MKNENCLRPALLNLIHNCPLGERKLWCPLKAVKEKETNIQLRWVDSLDKQDMQIFIKVCQKCFTDNNNNL
jgi:hypothetical protein